MAERMGIREALMAAWDRSAHDRTVLEVATEWKRKLGVLKVWADLEGWEKPPELAGFIPDVYVQGVGFQVAIEVETRESEMASHTKDQVSAFQRWSAAGPGRAFDLKLAS